MVSFNPYNKKDCDDLVEELGLSELTPLQSNPFSRMAEIAVLGLLKAKGFDIMDIPQDRREGVDSHFLGMFHL